MEKIRKHAFFIFMGLIFVFGVVLRLKTYLLANSLWHDEYALAGSILTRNFFSLLQPLEYQQKAPAIFMMLNKLVYYCFGISVLSLKVVPMLSGLFSVIIFYFLSKEILKNKTSIVVANLLFAVNWQLIYWAQKFKPYSSDVFLFIASILLYSKLDLDKLSYKKSVLLSFLSILLILTSFPCSFVVGGYILYCLLSRVNIKKTLSFALPMVIGSFIYYFKVLYTVQTREVASYMSYWAGGFLKFNIKSILLIFRSNFNFFFFPNNFVLFGIILFVTGLVLLLREKSKIGKIILFSFAGILLASFLQIYPIWQRTALYFLPVVVLLITRPLDLVSGRRKFVSAIIVCLFVLFFCKYNVSYAQNFFSKNVFMRSDAITTFPKLVEKYDNNKDILVLNSTTKADYIYYSRLYKFKPQRYFLLPVYRYDQNYYYSLMDSLPRGQTYWFIFGWEYSHRTHDLKNNIAHHLQTYIKKKHLKILEEYNDGHSILMKVKF